MMTQPEKKASAVEALCQKQRVKSRKEVKVMEIVERTYRAAVELFAFLCRKYGLNPLADGVIVSHKEGHDRGIASGHGDPDHLWKQLNTGYTMDTFRQAVNDAMRGNAEL